MHPNIWYPFTILKGAQTPHKAVSGKGIWLTLENGHEIVDCISSWWVNLHGHSHPDITEAIREQAEKLEHVIFANFSHEPAENLAEQLTAKLPGNINRVFYSDNGSTAVEIAIKMAWQYWRNNNQSRKKFIAFEGAYHGDTFGAMSAGARSLFTQVFNELLFEVEYLPWPETWMGDENASEREDQIIEVLENKLNQHPDTYAGIILEPLVQGAGGMRICREEFLQKLHWVQRQFDTLLIFDEVMTGFGRTGDWFASQKAQVEPDIICLAKGITGGFLPLAVTACSETVYDSFYSDNPMETLWHGHSYTANPLGCAAALASLKLLEENEDHFKSMDELHEEGLLSIATLERIEKPRVMGTIAAFNIQNEEESGYLNRIGNEIKQRCVDYDLLLRPLGDVLYLMPPYCISKTELEMVYGKLGALLKDLDL
ncbi:MAG: adenosylmethionine--8-amino-7-oxononanoate transaminase [Balneolaceae bacterium]